MNGFDDSMGGGPGSDDAADLREQAEALIPRMHVFDVLVERFDVDTQDTTQKTISVVAHSVNLADGKVIFFTLRFVAPDKLVSYVTRIIGGLVLDVVDQGEVPVSRILH